MDSHFLSPMFTSVFLFGQIAYASLLLCLNSSVVPLTGDIQGFILCAFSSYSVDYYSPSVRTINHLQIEVRRDHLPLH